jgi:hypothetical protein
MNNLNRIAFLAALAAGLFVSSASVHAQVDGGGGDDGGDIIFGNPIAGIDVDATGVLKVRQFDPRLAVQRFQAAKAAVRGEELPISKVG